MLNLNRLSHVLALAEERHFARAAERVHLSQPAFSRSIQALERDTGQRLFDRSGGDVRPTPAGAFLVERARAVLFDARTLEREMRLFGECELGNAAFGVGPFPAATLMPRVLPELRRRHPQVALRVEVTNWSRLLEHLRSEDVEFFVAELRSLPADAGLDVLSLGRQRGGFYARAGHPLAGPPCQATDLWRHGVVATRLPQAIKAAIAALLRMPDGHEPVFALECDDVSLLRSVALTTDSVLAATDAAVADDVRAGRIVPLAIAGLPSLYAEMGIVSLLNRSLSPTARRAVALIEAAAREVNVEQAPGLAPARRKLGPK